MAITYNWKIDLLDCYPTSSQGLNYVFVTHWRLNANETVNNINYTAETSGKQYITSSTGSFIPFNELTLNTVSGWIEESMGSEMANNIKIDLAEKINNQINPPTVSLQPPWL